MGNGGAILNIALHTPAKPILLTKEYLESQVDPDEVAATFHRFIEDDLNTRLRSGCIDPLDEVVHPVVWPEGFRARVEKIIRDRQSELDNKIQWLTVRRDQHGLSYHSFPLASYRFGLSYAQIAQQPSVTNALHRIRNREHIQSIKVAGPVPQHWYHGPIVFD